MWVATPDREDFPLPHLPAGELAKGRAREYLFNDAFTSRTAIFESWNITHQGITFNFDECRVTACAAGEQKVEIPFRTLEPLLNPRMLTIVFTEFQD